jgi:hypothetical protein
MLIEGKGYTKDYVLYTMKPIMKSLYNSSIDFVDKLEGLQIPDI